MIVTEEKTRCQSCLDLGAQINVEAPGCGMSVVRGLTAQVGRFSSWGAVVPKGFLAESAYFLSHICHSIATLSKRPSSYKRVNLHCTKNGT